MKIQDSVPASPKTPEGGQDPNEMAHLCLHLRSLLCLASLITNQQFSMACGISTMFVSKGISLVFKMKEDSRKKMIDYFKASLGTGFADPTALS